MAKHKKKTIMRTLTIKELSGVDTPAQVGARALIMKSADKPAPKSKVIKVKDLSLETIADMVKRGSAVLTTPTLGHTHLVLLRDIDGNKVVSGTTTWQDGHSHPWIMTEDDSILIGDVDDHGHLADKKSKLAVGDTTMTPEEKAKLDKAQATAVTAEALAKTNAKLAKRFESIAKFNDATKSYFGTLDESGQDAFIAKSADDQAADVASFTKAADDADPVVYTADGGDVYRKSDDPRLVKMAKKSDTDSKALAKSEAARKTQDLEKRAGEILPNLPGTIEVRAAMLEKVESIDDKEVRKSALEALVASNTAMSKAFNNLGANNSPTIDEGSPEAELEKLADDLAKSEKISHAAAYDKVLQTSKGAELYQKHKDSSNAATQH